MVVTNHPLASAAAAEILLGGGNAVDAAVAALFALTVVEPMMVGMLGGGVSHIRLPDGRHIIIDNLSCAPKAARADMYEPVSDGAASARDTRDRRNAVGASAVAVPGKLAGWTHMLAKHGTRPLHAVMRPAIRLAADGFTATSYLSECIGGMAADIARDTGLTTLFLHDGKKIPAGTHVLQADYAATLRRIADDGPDILYRGDLGNASRTICKQWRHAIRRRSSGLRAGRTRRRFRRTIAAAASSARRRRHRAASTSRRCSTFSKVSTSPRWASARPTAFICWPRS